MIFSPEKNYSWSYGGIVACKSCYLVRELIKRNVEVRVIMTPSVAEFAAPLTVSTFSTNKVLASTFPLSQPSELAYPEIKNLKVGSAAEMKKAADTKLNELDMIALNSTQDKMSGFEYDSNKISVIHSTGKQKSYSLSSMFQAANKIL